MALDGIPPALALKRLVDGYQLSQAIHVAARLGVADAIGDDTRASDDVARETGTDAPTLYRLLRALASAGVLHEHEGRRFSLTEQGSLLREDAPDSMHAWAVFSGQHWDAWAELGECVRTGDDAFHLRYGESVWEYRAARPELSRVFDAAMRSLSQRVARAVLDVYDFSRFRTAVDVGGGNGTLLAALVARHPHVEGVLFDQPHVVRDLQPPPGCRVEGGSFFEHVPPGGDVYVLKSILHDWPDDECVTILEQCRHAMADGAVLLVVERLLGGPNEDRDTKLSDLNMLVNTHGLERTPKEFAALFARAGLELAGITPAADFNVIEARASSA